MPPTRMGRRFDFDSGTVPWAAPWAGRLHGVGRPGRPTADDRVSSLRIPPPSDAAMPTDDTDTTWPALPYAGWRDTAATFQLWTQIVGKVRLALTPWLNHGWHVPLYVDARGLGTSPIHVGGGIVEIDFDLVCHRLVIRTSHADERSFPLEPMSVAAFHRRVTAEL